VPYIQPILSYNLYKPVCNVPDWMEGLWAQKNQEPIFQMALSQVGIAMDFHLNLLGWNIL